MHSGVKMHNHCLHLFSNELWRNEVIFGVHNNVEELVYTFLVLIHYENHLPSRNVSVRNRDDFWVVRGSNSYVKLEAQTRLSN